MCTGQLSASHFINWCSLLMTVRILKPRSFPKLNDFPYSSTLSRCHKTWRGSILTSLLCSCKLVAPKWYTRFRVQNQSILPFFHITSPTFNYPSRSDHSVIHWYILIWFLLLLSILFLIPTGCLACKSEFNQICPSTIQVAFMRYKSQELLSCHYAPCGYHGVRAD